MKNNICRILMMCELITLFLLCVILFRPHYTTVDVRKHMELKRVGELESVSSNTLVEGHKGRVYAGVEARVQAEKDKLLGQKLELNYEGLTSLVDLGEYVEVQGVDVNGRDFGAYKPESFYLFGLTSGMKLHDTKISLRYSYRVGDLFEGVAEILREENIKMLKPRTRFTGSSLEVIENGTEGRELDEVHLRSEIDRLLTDKKISDTRRIDAVYNIIKVSPTAEELVAINTKVASFSTGYSSSSSSRKKNIAIATKFIDGVLLLPGEVYSVDKGIRVRSASNGYEKSGSYLNGKTVQTYGGGVCQVSTTLYGAVLRAGLVPVERHAHSMTVGYVPIGLDAAIAEGYKDLKIENTYNSAVYIEGKANGSTLTFNIYGREDLLGGYIYKPESKTSNGGLRASAWLNKVYNGETVLRVQLSNSAYQEHK